MNNSPTTLTKVLSGINNTLNIANKIVPLYKEAKPIFNTVTTTFKTLKNNGNDLSRVIKLMKLKNEIKKDMSINNNLTINNESLLIKSSKYSNTNNPTFFV